MPSLKNAYLAIRELGWRQAGLFGCYQLGLRSGYFRLTPRPPGVAPGPVRLPPDKWPPVRILPARAGMESKDEAEIDRILAGQVELFGAVQVPLDFTSPEPGSHWTAFKSGWIGGKDVKLYWEPARFSWAVRLARAYLVHGDARGKSFFYRQVAAFMNANPPYTGLHWANGQEAALRLVHIAFAHLVFQGEGAGLPEAIAVHARRLPPTLLYARAQNNNHLLSEAAGLLTAGVLLPNHPDSGRWLKAGWRWLNRGFQEQIGTDGVYVQQSTNYHRLMLQLALWGRLMGSFAGLEYPAATQVKLAAAAGWLAAHCDPETGAVPNLGPNDGAWILPLGGQDFWDYRPVVQAAAAAFLSGPAFSPGPWDEYAGWMGLDPGAGEPARPEPSAESRPTRLQHPEISSRVFLRAVRFTARPGHADQLHADIWWQGRNMALDAGTYLYNAPPPWDNALQRAHHHNTLTLAGRDQMTRAGRFLYVDRAQARMLARDGVSAEAEHDGYRALGALHRRRIEAWKAGWRIMDSVLPAGSSNAGGPMKVRLHWLLPDFPWKVAGGAIHLESGSGPAGLVIQGTGTLSVIRAGERVFGDCAADPVMGWFSPTYAVREPALSVIYELEAPLPIRITSTWHFG